MDKLVTVSYHGHGALQWSCWGENL